MVHGLDSVQILINITNITGDTGGVERAVYQTRAEDKPTEDGSAAHRPPEGRAGHRAGGEET